jgi:hypothetical protein
MVYRATAASNGAQRPSRRAAPVAARFSSYPALAACNAVLAGRTEAPHKQGFVHTGR